ncbi:MAG: hypothetical protein ACT4OI_03395, partial [Methanobacteriota archaeon]
NGMGRTNGLTNGLVSLRRGITNGLTNGNGFTNGLGGSRFELEARLARWKLYLVPLVVVGLLLVPLFMPPDSPSSGLIQVDAQFADWPASALLSQLRRPGMDPNIDIERLGLVDDGNALAIYVAVGGQAFTGGGAPPRHDTLRLFLDTDRRVDTGYRAAGIGADRLVEVSGHGARVTATRLYEWDVNRNADDWNGWTQATTIPAAALGTSVELEIDWNLLVAPKAAVHAYAQFQAYSSEVDETDYVLASDGPSLVVASESSVAPVLVGADQELLRVHLRCYVATCSYSSIAVHLTGTAGLSAATSVRLRDGLGGLIQQVAAVSETVRMDTGLRTLDAGLTETLVVSADVTGSGGETLGAAVNRADDVIVSGGAVTLREVATARSVGYVGGVPSGIRIDGGFADWTNPGIDPSEVGRRPDVDLQEYAFSVDTASAALYLGVAGRALNGTLVPAANAEAPSLVPGTADSDRDTVPDAQDPFPFDFNNDGIVDPATANDYDGDAIQDYPSGPDRYLNTTIPSTFPPAYANR